MKAELEIHKGATGELTIDRVKSMIFSPNVSLVYDFDETIFGTAGIHRIATSDAIGEVLGKSVRITEEFGRTRLRGQTGLEICRTSLKHFGNSDDEKLVAQAVILRREALKRVAVAEQNLTQYLMPGVDQMVRGLRREQKQAGIASQSPDGFIHTFLQRVVVDDKSIEDVFPKDAVVGETSTQRLEGLGLRNLLGRALCKPSSFSVHLAESRVRKMNGDHVLYIGDTNIDAECVVGKQNMTGLIVNKDEGKRTELSLMYGQQRNIVITGSFLEVLQ